MVVACLPYSDTFGCKLIYNGVVLLLAWKCYKTNVRVERIETLERKDFSHIYFWNLTVNLLYTLGISFCHISGNLIIVLLYTRINFRSVVYLIWGLEMEIKFWNLFCADGKQNVMQPNLQLSRILNKNINKYFVCMKKRKVWFFCNLHRLQSFLLQNL